MSDMRWSSRFLSERRQARHYRIGRCSCVTRPTSIPHWRPGMNTGIGDAMNLGWKLAAAVHNRVGLAAGQL